MKDDDPDSISLDSQVKLPSDSEQFDLTAYAVAVAFNNASLPPDMPEWLKGIITGQAAQLRDSPEGVSRFNELSAEQARKSRQSDADERTEFQLGVIAQEQRQREEWLRTTHSLGNTTLTGNNALSIISRSKRWNRPARRSRSLKLATARISSRKT